MIKGGIRASNEWTVIEVCNLHLCSPFVSIMSPNLFLFLPFFLGQQEQSSCFLFRDFIHNNVSNPWRTLLQPYHQFLEPFYRECEQSYQPSAVHKYLEKTLHNEDLTRTPFRNQNHIFLVLMRTIYIESQKLLFCLIYLQIEEKAIISYICMLSGQLYVQAQL